MEQALFLLQKHQSNKPAELTLLNSNDNSLLAQILKD
jgi:hypothetical protein